MENAEAQLREIQLALRYCELDYEAILEDYRDHVRELKERDIQHQKRKTLKPTLTRKQAFSRNW